MPTTGANVSAPPPLPMQASCASVHHFCIDIAKRKAKALPKGKQSSKQGTLLSRASTSFLQSQRSGSPRSSEQAMLSCHLARTLAQHTSTPGSHVMDRCGDESDCRNKGSQLRDSAKLCYDSASRLRRNEAKKPWVCKITKKQITLNKTVNTQRKDPRRQRTTNPLNAAPNHPLVLTSAGSWPGRRGG